MASLSWARVVRTFVAAGALSAAVVAPGSASADDFRYVDREGRVHRIAFTPPVGAPAGPADGPSSSDVPGRSERPAPDLAPPAITPNPLAPSAAPRPERGLPGGERQPWGKPALVGPSAPVPYSEIIQEAAKYYSLPPELIVAVMRVESAFDPRAVSRAGAMGLMQLMPATAEDLYVTDPYDPRQSIFGGARLLRVLVNRFDGNVVLALAGYNAGPGAVERWGGIPPYPETMDYVVKVLSAYHLMLFARIETGPGPR